AGWTGFAVIGSTLYFSAFIDGEGFELRAMSLLDASLETIELYSGPEDGAVEPHMLTSENQLFFLGEDPTNGLELRILNSIDNTFATIDINEGPADSSPGKFGGLIQVG